MTTRHPHQAHDAASPDRPSRSRGTATLVVFALIAALVFAGFFALGTWQVQRRAWKLDLIARVDQRIHAPAIAAPGRDQWPQLNAANDEYRRVRATGTFLNDRETLIQASTELGTGFWVLTPLRMADGAVVLVNRGFVPPEQRDRAARGATEASGETTVSGLLRISEPSMAFLRRNDPATNLWYSRDVPAIAAARGLTNVAPYFIDADGPGVQPPAEGAQRAWPVGGLTVVSFYNNHLVYAITWYALAIMVAWAAWYVGRDMWRNRRKP
ncbi:SURF1 family protein [Cupriavidus basilensis]|uniref:SURF1 family protein n=1 Tax=Cupriavidus basilensis TaxID=68895 RepID=UPI003D346C30